MNSKRYRLKLIPLLFLLLILTQLSVKAQRGKTHWAADGYQYYRGDASGIVELDTRDASKKTVLVSTEMLTPPGKTPLKVANFILSNDGQPVATTGCMTLPQKL